MGGGIYSQDVARRARSSARRDAFAWSGYRPSDAQQAQAVGRRVHPKLDPHGTAREVNNDTPIIVAMDVTRSRGDDTKQMYDKLPMLMGQIELKGYVDGPGISFAAIGDATVDDAPLQVGQFEADNRLDEELENIWIEEGGGGTGQESYELAAFYYSRTDCVQLRKGTGRKGFCFFVGDEGFYPKVDKGHAKHIVGEELPADLDSAEAFRRLQAKFHTFLIYPRKTFEERKADIDAEIKARVTAAGGMYEGVDIRASLIWNDRNDLDLHVVPPSGEEIYYAHKQSRCGGELDVDRNVRGETYKPVENVRWPKDKAPKGTFRVFVQNYRFHEPKAAPIPFKVELQVGERVQHFEGTASPRGETGAASNVWVHEFDFDPADRPKAAKKTSRDEAYEAYSDDVILAQWGAVIPPEHILRVRDARAITDVLLGALAIANGRATLDAYLEDVKARGGDQARVEDVAEALRGVSAVREVGTVDGDVPSGPPAGGGQARGGRSKRLS